jgi:hypothetical protein
MEDTKMASPSLPPPPVEIKSEEQPAESKEVAEDAHGDDNAATPGIEPEAAATPTAAPATSLSRQTVDIIEGILHRVVQYKSEE